MTRDATTCSQSLPSHERDCHRPTVKALLRRGRFTKAMRATPPTVVVGWMEKDTWTTGGKFKVCTPDEDFAGRVGFQIRTEYPSFWRSDGSVRIRPRHLLVIPPWEPRNPGTDGKRGTSRIFQAMQWRIWLDGPCVDPDPVVETVLFTNGKERTIYLHSFPCRVSQRLYLQTLTPRADAMMQPFSHAYRPGRSRFTALCDVRALARQGFWYLLPVDIVRFFRSITVPLVEHVLQVDLPWVGRRLRVMGLGWLRPIVLRRPSHPRRRDGRAALWSTAPGHLLEGSEIAPFFANLIGNHVVDRPFAELGLSDAKIVRYCDNIMILATSPDEAVAVREGLVHALGAVGLRLHEDDLARDPVDVRKTKVRWLGKEIHGGSVLTPKDKLDELVGKVLGYDVSSHAFKQAVRATLNELSLDPMSSRERVRQELRSSPLHLDMFNNLAGVLRRRDRDPLPADPPPDAELEETEAGEGGTGS
jgi:hypothetical protein